MAPKDNKEGISRDAYDRMQSTNDTRETDSPMIPINVTPANDSSSSEAAGIRASVDAALDRIRRSTDSSERDRAPRRRRLSKLVPRRRKPTRDGLADNASENLSRHSSTVDQSLVSGPPSRSQSDTSLANGGSGRSSLLTDDLGDSDVETGKATRPDLTTRDSHTGYLTLSSPEFSNLALNDRGNTNDSSSSLPRTALLASSKDSISGARSGSPSAATRILNALTPSRKKLTEDPSASSSRRNSLNDGQIAVRGGLQELDLREDETQPLPRPNEPSRPSTALDSRKVVSPIQTTVSPSAARPETPKTFVTPPTPTEPVHDPPRFQIGAFGKIIPSSARNSGFGSADSIKHRRTQSAASAGKLSASIPPSLTPTVEETKTPGGTLTQPTSATGFFSSFISSAQKAADSLNNTINLSIGPAKNRSLSTRQISSVEEAGVDQRDEQDVTASIASSRPKTVDTLGEGDLSLQHLGIVDSSEPTPMSSTMELTSQSAHAQSEAGSRRAEEEAAARAVSSAYEKTPQSASGPFPGRPLSISSNDRLTLNGDQTPPRPTNEADVVKRSNSVRSKLSGRKGRHRNSSATNSIGAALQSTTSGLANLQANGPGHRLPGFAVASSRRNKDFHQLFRSVPEDDYLIEDYSAALQRDILLHGRLYVSEGHICFSSNILGWVTNLVMSFDEVVSVEKKSTAVIFPNAIVIQTLHARNTFASFVARDSTYELLIGIWKISHPNLKSSLNGVTLDNAGTGDKTEVVEPVGSEQNSEEGSEDEVYDEDEDDDDVGSFTDGGLGTSVAGSELGDPIISRKPSGAVLTAPTQGSGAQARLIDAPDMVNGTTATAADFPGPGSHAATECSEMSEHYDRPLTDTTIAAPLGKVYSLMFGPASGAFMRKWLVDEQKSRDLNYTDDKTGLDNDHKTFTFDYVKPLSAPVGPRQTKCITTNTLLALDLEKAVTIDCSTITPDVPSGSCFTTRTRYCLMWGPSNSTRIIATCTIEWSSKSWLKSAIEKGANDGQIEYVKSIVACLKTAVVNKTPIKQSNKKGKRREKRETSTLPEDITRGAVATNTELPTSDWGVLEPVRKIFEPIVGLVSPFLTSQVIIAVLFALLAYTWVHPPRGGPDVGLPGYAASERIAAYHEIWRREESELWDWLEDRAGLSGISESLRDMGTHSYTQGKKAQSTGRKLEDERMSTRQMNDAIRVTEERLSALKEAVKRKQN